MTPADIREKEALNVSRSKVGSVVEIGGSNFYVTNRNGIRHYQRINVADGSLTYACLDLHPYNVRIIDEDTGEPIDKTIEVNAEEGWLLRQSVDDEGSIYTCDEKTPCYACGSQREHVRTERLEGNFWIELEL